MSQLAFTDLTIKTLPLPAKHQRSYWDASLSGFGIRISKGGARTWVVLDPRAKVRTLETIGRYPTVSLADARAEAKRRLAQATLGKHKPRSKAWDAAVEEFLTEKGRKRRDRTVSDYRKRLRHFNFGATRLSEVSPEDVQKRLAKLSDRPSEEQHAFVCVRVFLRWAYRKHYLDEVPVARMEAPQEYVPRERVLSDEELGKIWRACGDDPFGRIVKLLILTGQRVGEVTKLSRAMVGADTITLPSWLAKNGKGHAFPLGDLARSVLPGGSDKLFPSRRNPERYFSGYGKSKARLDKAAGVYGWTLHDLRRTFATRLASLGVSIPVIERLLNHVSGTFKGIVGVYQHYDFMPEMREAIRKWEAHVLALPLEVHPDLEEHFLPAAGHEREEVVAPQVPRAFRAADVVKELVG